jgi:hypothetical protein
MGHPWTKKERGVVGYVEEYGRWQAGLRKGEPYGMHYGIDGVVATALRDAMDVAIPACGGQLRHGTDKKRRDANGPAARRRWAATYHRAGMAA